MNIEILDMLMDNKKIKSYYQLAKEMEFPYTTLLDLVHGRSINLYSIEHIANYFGVSKILLLEPTRVYQLLKEDNNISGSNFYFDLNQESYATTNMLLHG